MDTIELKPKPLLLATRVFLLVFVIFGIAKYSVFWSCPDFDTWLFLRARAIEALVATSVFCLLMVIPFCRKSLNIILTETTLQAPTWKRGNRWKSITVDLSEISISRSLRDRLNGAQVATNEGQVLRVDSFFYAPKSIPKLYDEIERRQEQINNPKELEPIETRPSIVPER